MSDLAAADAQTADFRVRELGRQPLPDVWSQMQAFTDERDTNTADEVWLVEHDPVYTLGMNADREHLLDAGDIQTVQIDRGGQVTYHGPGQLVAYVLWDLRRLPFSIRALVELLERAVIATVAAYGIEAYGRREAPGVYVDDAKLAALGLRVRRGCSYHGLALNVDMDLAPFAHINPCGMRGLRITQLADLGVKATLQSVGSDLCQMLARERRAQLEEADS